MSLDGSSRFPHIHKEVWQRVQANDAISLLLALVAGESDAQVVILEEHGGMSILIGDDSNKLLRSDLLKTLKISTQSEIIWQPLNDDVGESDDRRFRCCRIALQPPQQHQSFVVVVPEETSTDTLYENNSTLVQQENFRDTLTGLSNRPLFYDRLTKSLSLAKRNGGRFGLILVDVDHLDSVNETFGRREGDRYLQHLATQLDAVVRDSDTLARIGSDEFVVLINNIEQPDDIASVAEKLLTAANVPLFSSAGEIRLTASMGISLFPKDGETADALLRHADTAMSKAKEEGKNQHKLYLKNMTAPVVNYLLLENDLHQAMARDELRLSFQPQVMLSTNVIAGLEVLVRWQHPHRGMLPPSEFMPLAEETGVVEAIGSWALRKSCEIFARWLEQGFDFGTLSVNVSARQFRDHALIKLVDDILIDSGLPAERLELELTESSTMENVIHAQDMLRELSRKGINLALDDFGTGYSSMAYLHRFPINKLKIDKSFIDNLEKRDGDKAIIQSLIDLSRNLSLKVIAEGAETKGQIKWLREHGCDLVQGYYFSKPLLQDELLDFVKNSGRVTVDNNHFVIRSSD